jgi:hypothetical protein
MVNKNSAVSKRVFTDKLSGAPGRTSGANRGAVPLARSRYPCRLETASARAQRERIGGPKGLVDLVNELEDQKVHFQSITHGVDTKTPAGHFFFT